MEIQLEVTYGQPPILTPITTAHAQLEVTYGQLSPELETASKLMDLAVAHTSRRLGALYDGGMVSQVVLRSPVRALCVRGQG